MELFGITITEYIGYLASFMVLLSFTMKDVKKLRMVNMAGCILFVVYGFLMPTLRVGLPIIIANAAILGVNMFYLVKAKSKIKPL
ncbi:uroporphyrinogen decarboxylase [Winogradskyella sp. MH6]|uniref:uroporphyrinogen decarboxylase n=1 Tax=Winogradskyella sp. MH6 TaxID=2929510 RepID=UPI001FB3E8E3|nr:uroporphyrinogen decarboxylase [Winogradskyella sp. MH6]